MYENFAKKLGQFKHIYLYGNGSFTKLVKIVLEKCGLKYDGVIVSEGCKNGSDEFEINDINADKDSTCILVTVGDYAYTDIVSNVCRYGYYNLYFFSTDEKAGIRYIHGDSETLKKAYYEKNQEFLNEGGSSKYWDERYKTGDMSGSGAGSYNKLAEFKSKILNQFLSEHKEIKICYEFGFGDGNQLSFINYPEYVGGEVSEAALNICKERFKEDRTKKFFLMYDMMDYIKKNGKCDLSISLDVLFNLVEDEVYELYMQRLFTSTDKYVCIYSSNIDRPHLHHERRRKFTDYVEKKFPEFKLMLKVDNEYPYDFTRLNETSLSDFYFYKK